MQKDTKPCMIAWPAMTATIELPQPKPGSVDNG
jgi:hypothetical protein